MADGWDFRFKRGTKARWEALNPVLGSGEPGVEVDTGLFKIGDGHTPWLDIAYYLTEPYVTGIVEVMLAATGDSSSDPRVGNLNELSTVAKNTIVNAINEVNDDASLLLLYDNAKAG